MGKVTFYQSEQDSVQGEAPAHYHLASKLAADFYQQGKWFYIYTDDQRCAEWIDELLWCLDPDQFVPHQLQGEVAGQKAPIEIIWDPPKSKRALLINLAQSSPEFAPRFEHVIDFVPADENLKQLARDRYKQYRQMGLQLDVIQPGQ